MKQVTVSAGMISVPAKEKLTSLSYNARMTQRQVLESLILNAEIIQPVRVEIKSQENS